MFKRQIGWKTGYGPEGVLLSAGTYHMVRWTIRPQEVSYKDSYIKHIHYGGCVASLENLALVEGPALAVCPLPLEVLLHLPPRLRLLQDHAQIKIIRTLHMFEVLKRCFFISINSSLSWQDRNGISSTEANNFLAKNSITWFVSKLSKLVFTGVAS